MEACGLGVFVPFGEIVPGTLFLDHAPGAVNDTAILLKVRDGGGRDFAVRIFDQAAIDHGRQMPGLAPAPAADRRVIALFDYGIEIENSVDNVVWESAPDFVRAVVFARGDGALCIKAYRGRHKDDFECQLFDLATGAAVDLDREVVGFRRWSIIGRTARGERVDFYRFEA